jgi:hypothetical protein
VTGLAALVIEHENAGARRARTSRSPRRHARARARGRGGERARRDRAAEVRQVPIAGTSGLDDRTR